MKTVVHAGLRGPTAAAIEPRARALAFIVLAAIGLVQCWRYRHFMYPDGIQYLDMARLAAGDSAGWLVNGYWSPLYPALLAIALWLCRPSPYWMYPTVQLVNAVVYLAATAAFAFLLRTLLRLRRGDDTRLGLSDAALTVASASCFLAFVTYLINVRMMMPDMIVATAILAAAALLLRASADAREWLAGGIALAAGYYAKAVMFPASLALVAILFVRGWRRRTGIRGPALMLTALAVGVLPLVIAVSMKTGRPTFGESGRINYAWYVNRWGTDLHWIGEPPESGTPRHRLARLVERPPAYEFRYPGPVTYPLFFDPAYWTDGMRIHFRMDRQLSALARTAGELRDILYVVLLPILSLLAAAALTTRHTREALARHAPALWLAAIPVAIYLPLHVEGRFIGGSMLVASMVLLSSLRVRERHQRWTTPLAAAMAVAALVTAGPVAAGAVRQASLDLRYGEARDPSRAWRIAAALHRLGIPDGTEIASIGANIGADWAQLARLRIVAEIGPAGRAEFLSAPPPLRRAVLQRLAADGTRPVVIDAPAALVDPEAADLDQSGFSVLPARQRMERYAGRHGDVQ